MGAHGVLPRGSLRDLLQQRPKLESVDARNIVREITAGLEAIGSANIVHGDLRPANILVRARHSLDLVLADFGGARILNQFREHGHAGLGTPAYQPPESVVSSTVTPSHDYWSLGVIIYEMLTGEHPFAADLDDSARFLIGIRHVDLSGIESLEWRYLIGGLLVRDPDKRWGATQINRWLNEELPDLPAESPFFWTGFVFEGDWYHSAESLADAVARQWDAGMRLVSGERSFELLSEWLESLRGADAAAFSDTMGPHDRGPDYRVAALLSFLNPSLPPIFRERSIGYDHLSGLASEAVKKPESAAALDVSDLFISHALAAFGPADVRLPNVDRQWHTAVSDFEGYAELARSEGLPALTTEELRVARARILHAIVDPRARATLEKRATSKRRLRVARREEWFDQIVSDHSDSIGGLVAVSVYADAVTGRVKRSDGDESEGRSQSRGGIVGENRAIARESITRYLSIAAVLTLPAAYAAGELTYQGAGGFADGLIVCGAAAAVAVVTMIATDFAMAQRPTEFEDPPAGRWIYGLTGGLGLLAWYLTAGVWVEMPSPTTLGWVIPPLAIALGHVFVRAPSATAYGRGRSRWEQNLLRYAGLPGGSALVVFAVWSLPGSFIERVRWAAEQGDITGFAQDTELLAVVLWGVVVGTLVATSGFREQWSDGAGGFFGFVVGSAVAALGLYVLVPWESPGSAELWVLSATWVGTGLQLVVRYRPPRVFWLAVGAVGLGGVLGHLPGIVPSLVSGAPPADSLLYLTWALASIRLVGVGGEDLIG